MPQTQSEIALQQLLAMGISARAMQDGSCVLASMPLGQAPFAGPAGPQRIAGVLFATVGTDQIKCLRPSALFQLPIISIQGCLEPASIEARIRSAWQIHAAEVTRTLEWLNGVGTEASAMAGGSALSFHLDGEGPRASAIMIDRHHVILPSAGKLSGACLRSNAERVMALPASISSGISLDIAVSARLDELAHRAARADENRRHEALSAAPAVMAVGQDTPGASHILVVGRRLASDQSCIASLRLRGYNVTTATSQPEALACYDRVSPVLVLSDVDLGRSDGIELILALRDLAGVEDLPVILVDDHNRPARREAARQVGAAGYITYPIDVSKIAKHLARIITAPRQRRFTRYASRLPVQAAGSNAALLASALGRGGMYLSTAQLPELNTVNRYRLSLPDLGKILLVEAQVIYTAPAAALRGNGAGLRFWDFPDADEELLIRYLRSLEKRQDDF
jgi:two-component system chemotaxis response regulator CheY